MELTDLAKSLKEARETERDLTQDEENLATCMGSENFSYALYEGGYLKPEDWIKGKDLEKLCKAINLVEEFKDLVEKLHEEF